MGVELIIGSQSTLGASSLECGTVISKVSFVTCHVYLLLLHCICAIIMMSDGKRKKSGACSRKLNKARVEEESKLGAFMKNYLTARSVSIDSATLWVQVTPAQSPYDNITYRNYIPHNLGD